MELGRRQSGFKCQGRRASETRTERARPTQEEEGRDFGERDPWYGVSSVMFRLLFCGVSLGIF